MKSGFKMKGMAFGNSPVTKDDTRKVANSRVTSKDIEYEIQVKKMIKNPNWNAGKKRSDMTPAELEMIRDPRYQAVLSKYSAGQKSSK